MRSSKSRSRSKSNRPRPVGNIVNRVFDSSGPDGKVRGTPQQIIEKYLFLARDAQLSNDRVAAENFLQHAEHYTRMLGEANRELAAEQEQRQSQGGYGQHGGGGQGNGNQNGGNQNGGQARSYNDRGDAQPDVRRDDDRGDQRGDQRADRPRNDGQRGDGPRQDNQRRDDRLDQRNENPRNDNQRGDGQRGEPREGGQRFENQRRDRRDEPRSEPRAETRTEMRAPAPVVDEQPDLPSFIVDPRPFAVTEDDSGLVDTPEARPKPRRVSAPRTAPDADAPAADAADAAPEGASARSPRRPRGPRKPRDDRPDGDGTPREAAE